MTRPSAVTPTSLSTRAYNFGTNASRLHVVCQLFLHSQCHTHRRGAAAATTPPFPPPPSAAVRPQPRPSDEFPASGFFATVDEWRLRPQLTIWHFARHLPRSPVRSLFVSCRPSDAAGIRANHDHLPGYDAIPVSATEPNGQLDDRRHACDDGPAPTAFVGLWRLSGCFRSCDWPVDAATGPLLWPFRRRSARGWWSAAVSADQYIICTLIRSLRAAGVS